MLDLTSPVWGKLQGPYGFSDRVPSLLQHIQHDYFSEEKEELYRTRNLQRNLSRIPKCHSITD